MLSHCVQSMRKTRQTAEYIEKMGPFFTGRAVWMRDDALDRVGAEGPPYTIDSIDDKVVTLEIARNTKVRVLRRTIQSTEQDAISGEADATKSKDTSKDSDDGGDEASSDDGDDTKSKSKKKDKKQSEEW